MEIMTVIKKKKAIFLDRDGVLIRDNDLITSWNQVAIFDGVVDALRIFKRMDYLLFILSNQSVVARGLISENECKGLHQQIIKKIWDKSWVEESYLCPYHPDAQIAEYRKDHSWRKPNSGALKHWLETYHIDNKLSYMVGDRVSDIICANDAGCNSVLIGEGIEQYTQSKLMKNENPKADYKFNSLLEFASFLQAKI